MSDENHIKPLVSALQGESGMVQRYAAGMLGRLASAEAVEPLIEALSSENKGVRMQAAKSLTKIGRPAVLPLIASLHSDDAEVWKLTAAVLVKIGAPAVDHLMEALSREPEAIQILVIEILGQIGDERGIWALTDLLHSSAGILRTVSAVALARIGVSAIPALLSLMVDFHDPELQSMIKEIVKRIGQPAVSGLLRVVQEGSELERNQAGWLLSEMGDAAVPGLREALLNVDESVRYTAAWALGNIGNPIAVPDLSGRLSDTAKSAFSGLRVCDVAAKSLEKIATPEALKAVEFWKRAQAKRL